MRKNLTYSTIFFLRYGSWIIIRFGILTKIRAKTQMTFFCRLSLIGYWRPVIGTPLLRAQIAVNRQGSVCGALSWWRNQSPDRQSSGRFLSTSSTHSLLFVLKFRQSWKDDPRWFFDGFLQCFRRSKMMKGVQNERDIQHTFKPLENICVRLIAPFLKACCNNW